MLEHQTMKKGKTEFMLFPGTGQWSVAQYWGDRGQTSHCCNHAMDWCTPISAPCTVISQGCIDTDTNCELWVSENPVWIPSQKTPTYISFQVGHQEHMHGAGTRVQQGEFIASPGTFMYGHSGGCDAHLHIEFAIGALSVGGAWGGGVPCSGGGGGSKSSWGGGATGAWGGGSNWDSIGEVATGGFTCYPLISTAPYYDVCYMNDTPGEQSSPYAANHKYAKGLSWFVPKEQRALAENEEELFNNFRCVYGFFRCLGELEIPEAYQHMQEPWTRGAIIGLLANMQNESGVNPNKWENGTEYDAYENPNHNSHGYGLVQWTPWGNITNYLKALPPVDASLGANNLWDESKIDPTVLGNAECIKIFMEYCTNDQWMATSAWPDSFQEWAHSTKYDSREGAMDAAEAFLRNYERPFGDGRSAERRKNAQERWDEMIRDNWAEEMPGGGMKAIILNPWDLADDVVSGSKFQIKANFVPYYYCPYDTTHGQPINFYFAGYKFTNDIPVNYQKIYFGTGGHLCNESDKAVATNWLAWIDNNDAARFSEKLVGGEKNWLNEFNTRTRGHFFAPSTSDAYGGKSETYLYPYAPKNGKIQIDEEYFDKVFPLNEGKLEKPNSKKEYFYLTNTPVIYNLIQTGDYDKKALKIRKASNYVAIYGTNLSAAEQVKKIVSEKFREISHLCIDSDNIIQTLSLDRKCQMTFSFSEEEKQYDNEGYSEFIGIYLTNTQQNNDTKLAEKAVAELFYQGYVSGNPENNLVINMATDYPFDKKEFIKKVNQELESLKADDLMRERSKVLAKIQSQKKYEIHLSRMDHALMDLEKKVKVTEKKEEE